MLNFAIIGKEPGSLLQWIGLAADQDAAVALFATDAGLEQVNDDDYRVIEMTDEEAIAVMDWHTAGASANEAPDCIA